MTRHAMIDGQTLAVSSKLIRQACNLAFGACFGYVLLALNAVVGEPSALNWLSLGASALLSALVYRTHGAMLRSSRITLGWAVRTASEFGAKHRISE